MKNLKYLEIQGTAEGKAISKRYILINLFEYWKRMCIKEVFEDTKIIRMEILLASQIIKISYKELSKNFSKNLEVNTLW